MIPGKPYMPSSGPSIEGARSQLERMKGDSPEKIRAAAAQFEAVFLTQMFKQMRATVPDGLLAGGFGGKVYQEMLDGEHAKTLAAQGGLGLGQMLAREIGGEAAANARLDPSALDGAQPRGGYGLSRPWEKGGLGGLMQNVRELPFDQGAWPAPGKVTSGFGVRRDPLDGHQKFHAGVDLATPSGTPVRAVMPGRVVESGPRGGYGNVVVVDHGEGLQSLYAHNSEVLATVGTPVDAGTPISLSGSTGRSTGPHVHFEMRKGGVPIDPTPYLRGGR